MWCNAALLRLVAAKVTLQQAGCGEAKFREAAPDKPLTDSEILFEADGNT